MAFKPVHVRGAAKRELNGVYDPTDELSTGARPVYQKRDGSQWRMEYLRSWMVKSKEDVGKETGFLQAADSPEPVPEAAPDGAWREWVDAKWQVQPGVSVRLYSGAVHVRGATSLGLNGVYDPTDELSSSGRPIYRKRDGSGRLIEHINGWMVKAKKDAGKSTGKVSVTSSALVPQDVAAGTWEEWVSVESKGRWRPLLGAKTKWQWQIQPGLSMKLYCEPVHVRGAAKCELNGVYDPTDELSAAGRPIYQKRDGSEWLIEYVNSWMVKSKEDAGKNNGLLEAVICTAPVPEAVPDDAWRAWVESKWQAQRGVSVRLSSEPVHVRGAAKRELNGVYDPTDELSVAGRPIYQKRDGSEWFIEYVNSWMVKSKEDAGKGNGFLEAVGFSAQVPEAVPDGSWREQFDSQWQLQPGVSVRLCSVPVHVRGASKRELNGVYDPTDELSAAGRPIYQKRDGSGCLIEYITSWMVKPKKNASQSEGWLDAKDCYGQVPEAVPDGAWLEWGDSQWKVQSGVSVREYAGPVHVRGASDLGSHGAYDPTDRLSVAGRPIYEKRDGSDWLIEHINCWMIKNKNLEGKSRGRYSASTDCSALVPEAVPAGTWQESDSGWQVRPGLSVKQFSEPVHLRGAPKRELNGVYDPTDELRNGRPVYKRRDGSGWLIEYTYRWMVKSEEQKGKNIGLLLPGGTDRLMALGPIHDDTRQERSKAQTGVSVTLCSKPVHVRGAAKRELNGVYDPTDELSVSGRPIYQKRDGSGWFIEYIDSWMVKSSGAVGKKKGFLEAIDCVMAPEAILDGIWLEWIDSKWRARPGVSVKLASEPVHVRGAAKRELNGVYDPTDEVSTTGRPIYQKRDGSEWLIEYVNSWMVKSKEDAGKSNGLLEAVGCSAQVPQAALHGTWQEWVGSKWQMQPGVSLRLYSGPVHLQGAAKFEMNGVYDPTDELSAAGRPVYQRRDNREWLIEYVNSWMVKTEKAKGESKGHAEAKKSCSSFTPEAVPAGAWEEYVDSKWLAQIALTVKLYKEVYKEPVCVKSATCAADADSNTTSQRSNSSKSLGKADNVLSSAFQIAAPNSAPAEKEEKEKKEEGKEEQTETENEENEKAKKKKEKEEKQKEKKRKEKERKEKEKEKEKEKKEKDADAVSPAKAAKAGVASSKKGASKKGAKKGTTGLPRLETGNKKSSAGKPSPSSKRTEPAKIAEAYLREAFVSTLIQDLRAKRKETKILHHGFLSHVQLESAAQCGRLCEKLESFGVRVWFDKSPDTKRLDKKGIVEAISVSACFVLYASKGYFSRPWCLFELIAAQKLQAQIVVIRENWGQNKLTFDELRASYEGVEEHEILETLDNVQANLYGDWVEKSVAKRLKEEMKAAQRKGRQMAETFVSFVQTSGSRELGLTPYQQEALAKIRLDEATLRVISKDMLERIIGESGSLNLVDQAHIKAAHITLTDGR